ncbi:MAG: oligosaccharide flippase family protein [Candidatus Protistobacter heckmanni]|nr:oligosaccharide flippase family protein [Candidatus Protistobacter heckmanni]
MALQLVLLGVSPALFVPLVIRMVGPETYAGIAVMQVVTGYLVVLVSYGFHLSGPAMMGRAATDAERAGIFWSALRAKLMLLALALCLFTLTFPLLGRPAGAQPHLAVFALLLCAFAGNSVWYLQSLDRFAPGALLAAAGAAVGILLLISNAWMLPGTTAYAAVLALILPQVCVGAGSFAATVPGLAPARQAAVRIADTLRAEFPVFLSQFAMLAYMSLGTLAVSFFHSPETTAAYAAAEKLFNTGSVLLATLYSAAYPRLAGVYHRDLDAYWRLNGKILALFVGLAAVGESVLIAWQLPLLGVYVGADLAPLIAPQLPLFWLWLASSIFGHMASGHLVIAGKWGTALRMTFGMAVLSAAAGLYLCRAQAGYWMAGMLLAQCLPLCLLLKAYMEMHTAQKKRRPTHPI